MIGNIFRQESAGELDIQITQLEHHLRSIEQQQMLNNAQPSRKAELIQERLMIQLQLQQLYQAISRN